MGLLFAHTLSPAFAIRLIVRKNAPTQYHYRRGSRLSSVPLLPCTADSCGRIETLLITTKAYQALAAFREVKAHLSPSARVILSHNGMGNVDEISAELSETQSLFFLTTSQGALKPAPDTVEHTGHGASQLGACNSAARNEINQLYGELAPLIHGLEQCDDIRLVRWQKLLVNVAINPLSAFYRVRNGELRAPHYALQVLALLNEAVAVARAEGLDIALGDALQRAYLVMALTAGNSSSMLEDVRQKRQSEIDAICGYIVKQGKKYGIETPCNQFYLNRISEMTHTS